MMGISGDRLLADLYGSADVAQRAGARSFLASGFYRQAVDALRKADTGPEARRLAAYAEGMCAYLDGDYPACTEALGRWIDQGPPADEAHLAPIACSALSRLGQLVGREGELPGAVAVADRIVAVFPVDA